MTLKDGSEREKERVRPPQRNGERPKGRQAAWAAEVLFQDSLERGKGIDPEFRRLLHGQKHATVTVTCTISAQQDVVI